MFGKTIPLVSLLLLSSKALAQIPPAFTTGFDPSTTELVVTYDGPGEIKDGETLTAADTNTVPQFALGDSSAITTSTNYIILMMDPDSPERDDNVSSQVLHYMKTDFSVKELTKLSSVASAPAVPYVGPAASVGSGMHRYIFLMYVQPAGFMNKLVPQGGSRSFNVTAWKTENNLKPAVAGVHFIALPGGGAASVSSSAAGGAYTTAKSSAVTPPPCTSTVMKTSAPASAPAVGLTTSSAAPPKTTPLGTVTLIASPPSGSPPAASSAASSVAPAPTGATHLVIVGGPNALLTYQPSSVNAAAGDIVKFDFRQKNHTVTQSTFDNPCVFNPAGVKSGFRPNPDGIVGKEIFEYTVPDTKPQWFFCGQTGHCKAGMVFAVNPGTKFPEYLAKATGGAAASGSTPPTLVPTGTGGVATATGNTTVPGATGVPVFQGAASRGVAVSWALVGIAGILALM